MFRITKLNVFGFDKSLKEGLPDFCEAIITVLHLITYHTSSDTSSDKQEIPIRLELPESEKSALNH